MLDWLLQKELGFLSSREVILLAIAVCSFVFFVIRIPDLKFSILNMLRIFFSGRIQVVYFSSLVYITLCVILLKNLGLWQTFELKDTIMWAVSSSSLILKTFINVKNSRHLKSLVTDQLKVFAIVEYFITFYTMPIWAECLLQPTLLLLSIVRITKDQTVKNISDKAFQIIGTLIVIYGLIQLLQDLKYFLNQESLYSFLLPISLLVLYIPFIYFAFSWSRYESIFTSAHFKIKNKDLMWYFKKKSILTAKLDTVLVDRINTQVQIFGIDSKNDIDNLMHQVKCDALNEKNPPVIASDKGWSAWNALHYLQEYNLKITSYSKVFEDEDGHNYHASACKQLIEDTRYRANNVSYYLNGEKDVAKELKLHCYVDSNRVISETREMLAEIVSHLYLSAMDVELDSKYVKRVKKGKDFNFEVENIEVTFIKHYPSPPSKLPYYLKFNLKVNPLDASRTPVVS